MVVILASQPEHSRTQLCQAPFDVSAGSKLGRYKLAKETQTKTVETSLCYSDNILATPNSIGDPDEINRSGYNYKSACSSSNCNCSLL